MEYNSKNKFEELVRKGNPLGEVMRIDGFLCFLKGFDKAHINSFILFESGATGMIKELNSDYVLALIFHKKPVKAKELAVLVDYEIQISVGDFLLGRVVDPLCNPRDLVELNIDENTVEKTSLFHEAPKLMERDMITEQLETGVTIVDALYPIAKGQRQAIVGDAKSGKTTFLRQLINHQAGKDIIVVYVFMGKKMSSISRFVKSLRDNNALSSSVVIITDLNDTPALSYIAPYSGCSIAEYFWRKGKDVIIVYDDLTTHAKIYREIALESFVTPGRESYPGDIFYIHSSLLERAGKLRKESNGGTLTAFPIVSIINGDVTAYISTNVMSMTDGQLIFDIKTLKNGIAPAIVSTSVSRVGKRTQSPFYKTIATNILRSLSSYQAAEKYSHFGTELAISTKSDLNFGQKIYELFNQMPEEYYTLDQQQLLLAVLLSERGRNIALEEIPMIKQRVKDFTIPQGADFNDLADRYLDTVYESTKSN